MIEDAITRTARSLTTQSIGITVTQGRIRFFRNGPVDRYAAIAETGLMALAAGLAGITAALWVLPGAPAGPGIVATKLFMSLAALATALVLARAGWLGLKTETVIDPRQGEFRQYAVSAKGRARQIGRMPLDWVESFYIKRGRGGRASQFRAHVKGGGTILIGSAPSAELERIHHLLRSGDGGVHVRSAQPVRPRTRKRVRRVAA